MKVACSARKSILRVSEQALSIDNGQGDVLLEATRIGYDVERTSERRPGVLCYSMDCPSAAEEEDWLHR